MSSTNSHLPESSNTQKNEKSDKKSQVQPNTNPFYYYVSNDVPISKIPPKDYSNQKSSRSRSRDKRKQHKHKHIHKTHEQSHSHSRRNHREINETISKEEAYYKTKLCPLYTQGTCRKGSACNFAHGNSQLKGLPDFKKTKLCIAFKEGKCGKPSNECKYAHGESELKRLKNEYQQKKKSVSPKRDYTQNLNMAYMIPGNIHSQMSQLPPPINTSGSYPIYPPASSLYPPMYSQPIYYPPNQQYEYGYPPPTFYPYGNYNPPKPPHL